MKKEEYYNKTLKELNDYIKVKEQKIEKLGKKDFLLMIPIVCFAPIPISGLSILMYSTYMLKIFYGAIDFQSNYIDLYLTSVEYQELNKVYKIVLEELSSLFEKMEFDNEMKIFAGYYYLLRNGYLSVEKSFYYRRNIEHAKLLEGANIMEGYGNCRNISGMLTDLLQQSNYEVYNISMLLPEDAKFSIFNYDFIEEIQEKVEILIGGKEIKENVLYRIMDNLFSLFNIQKPNHLVTLFRNDIHSYGIDPTNNAIFRVDDKIGSFVEGGNNYYIHYDKIDNRNQKNKLSSLLKTTSCELVDSLVRDYYTVYDSCSSYTDIFEKFYQEHRCLYEEVVDKKKILVREYSKNKPY